MQIKRILIQVFVVCFISIFSAMPVMAENMWWQNNPQVRYTNPDTGYSVTIEDDCNLLSDEEEIELVNVMKELTAYGCVGFKSLIQNQYLGVDYGKMYMEEMFISVPNATLIVYDVVHDEVQIARKGSFKRFISGNDVNSILDNVSDSLKEKNYYVASIKIYEQELALIHGEKIAEPMKYVCNALLALICGIFINYLILKKVTTKEPVANIDIIHGAYSKIDLKDYKVVNSKRK